MAIEKGTLVKVGGMAVQITTVNREGRTYERTEHTSVGRPKFGTIIGTYEEKKAVLRPETDDNGVPVLDGAGNPVMIEVEPAKVVALVRWAGPKYRTSILPVKVLQPAVNRAKHLDSPLAGNFSQE